MIKRFIYTYRSGASEPKEVVLDLLAHVVVLQLDDFVVLQSDVLQGLLSHRAVRAVSLGEHDNLYSGQCNPGIP